MSTSLNTAEAVLQRGFVLPALSVATSHLALVNVCCGKEQSIPVPAHYEMD